MQLFDLPSTNSFHTTFLFVHRAHIKMFIKGGGEDENVNESNISSIQSKTC